MGGRIVRIRRLEFCVAVVLTISRKVRIRGSI
jgi:hypothetical protein